MESFTYDDRNLPEHWNKCQPDNGAIVPIVQEISGIKEHKQSSYPTCSYQVLPIGPFRGCVLPSYTPGATVGLSARYIPGRVTKLAAPAVFTCFIRENQCRSETTVGSEEWPKSTG